MKVKKEINFVEMIFFFKFFFNVNSDLRKQVMCPKQREAEPRQKN